MASAKKAPRLGVALGGGAARGWAHVGLLRALQEGGVYPSSVAGTSMGALVGLFAAAGALDTLYERGRALDRRTLLSFVDVVLPRSGLIDGARLTAFLRQFIEAEDFRALDTPLSVVAACLESGNEVVLDEGDPIDAVRASISVPGMFKPVRLGGKLLVDGGLVNPVPVNVARGMGADFVVAVDVNHCVVEERPYLLPLPQVDSDAEDHLPTLLSRLVPNLALPAWVPGVRGALRAPAVMDEAATPSILGVVLSSIVVTEVAITGLQLAAHPPDILVRPRVGHIRFLDFHRAEEAIQAGYEAGLAALPEIRARLEWLSYRRKGGYSWAT